MGNEKPPESDCCIRCGKFFQDVKACSVTLEFIGNKNKSHCKYFDMIDKNKMEIPIKYKGKVYFAIIDSVDWPLIKDYKWHLMPSKSKTNPTFYVVHSINENDKLMMHNLIMNPPSGMEVDHINQNGMDNRRNKMRLITRGGNARNTKKENNSGRTGVRILPSGRFQAQIVINYKAKNLGSYDTIDEAGAAYQDAYDNQLKKEII